MKTILLWAAATIYAATALALPASEKNAVQVTYSQHHVEPY
jgi:hypothetical protein